MNAGKDLSESIDEYIAGFPADVQAVLQRIRMTIRKAAPDATEAIKYRIPTFVLGGNLVHFAALKEHIGFYPTPSAIDAFKNELSRYTCSKGAIQFPINTPIPMRLVEKIVRFRVKETKAQSASKNRKVAAVPRSQL
ncbi:MAG: DUF1801 domain-containing protein [Alphaproteobacteria bacterium]|nr:DUF1801 domain-containing protein [Alphaproteobacteria bacterium]